jgi:tRNA pseudouridine55 synthase
MNTVISIIKKLGETPLEALNRLRVEAPQYATETLSYAGRLDPMATGVMLVLVGDANKKRAEYLNLEKKYTTEILIGVSTDTYDTLGLVTDIIKEQYDKERIEEMVREKVRGVVGTFSQKYPEFSSKPVFGEPLFVHARSGRHVTVPVHDVTVYSSNFLSCTPVTAEHVLSRIHTGITSVGGDFRQTDIWNTWQSMLGTCDLQFLVVTLELSVSSGFYIRQYAHDLGVLVGIPACVLSIDRTQVGQWGKKDCVI